MAWSFLHSFGEILGLWPATVDELLAALAAGQGSRLCGEVHTALLRLLQADMEEAHATGAVQVCVSQKRPRVVCNQGIFPANSRLLSCDEDPDMPLRTLPCCRLVHLPSRVTSWSTGSALICSL